MGGEGSKLEELEAQKESLAIEKDLFVFNTIIKSIEKEESKETEIIENEKKLFEDYSQLLEGNNKLMDYEITIYFTSIILKIFDNLDQIVDEIDQDSYNFLVLGGSQQGKSSLINLILGSNLLMGDGCKSETKEFRNTTSREKESFLGENKTINMIDSVGLFDNEENGTENELQLIFKVYTHFAESYLSKINKIVSKIDLILIVQMQKPNIEYKVTDIFENLKYLFGDMIEHRTCLVLTGEDIKEKILNSHDNSELENIKKIIITEEILKNEEKLFGNRVIRVKNQVKEKIDSGYDLQKNKTEIQNEIKEILDDISDEPPIDIYKILFEGVFYSYKAITKEFNEIESEYENICEKKNESSIYSLDENALNNFCCARSFKEHFSSKFESLNEYYTCSKLSKIVIDEDENENKMLIFEGQAREILQQNEEKHEIQLPFENEYNRQAPSEFQPHPELQESCQIEESKEENLSCTLTDASLSEINNYCKKLGKNIPSNKFDKLTNEISIYLKYDLKVVAEALEILYQKTESGEMEFCDFSQND